MDERSPREVTTKSGGFIASYLGLRGDPDRLPTVLTNALIVGFAALVAIGTVELLVTRDFGAFVQTAGSATLLLWAEAMKRRGTPKPALLLGVAATLSFGYLLTAALDPALADVTDTSPIAIIVGSGVLALAAGGRDSVRVGVYSLVIATLATAVVQFALEARPIDLVVDSANTLVVMAVAFSMVRLVRRAMEDNYSRYRGLVESAPVVVVEVDLAAYLAGSDSIRLGPMNFVASSVLGYRDGRTETILTRDAIPAEFAEILEMTASAPSGNEVRTFSDGRTFKIGWQVNRTTGSVTLSGTDITAERRAEEELSGQVSARDRFIATVSHELRTPLTGAMGMLELVRLGDIGDGAERDEMIDIALQQVKDMADIVEDLLVAARAASGHLKVQPQNMNLSEAVGDVLSVIGDNFDREIDEDVWAHADPVRVRQIVKNLVTNAVRYGGVSRSVGVRPEGRSVVVDVSDDGPALAPEFVAKMFEPYERKGGKSPSESVGLGLTVARTLAELMGGDVDYAHAEGRSRFRLTLPVARQTAPS
jgi:signal transduction histidine kinase